MKRVFFLLLVACLLAGVARLAWLGLENRRFANEITQLESEVGRMTIDDPDRVYIVAIEKPDVPPEVASRLDGVWQFRCYFPPGYNFSEVCGGDRIGRKGIYMASGPSTSWGRPPTDAVHTLLTISIQRSSNHYKLCFSFDQLASTMALCHFHPIGGHNDTMPETSPVAVPIVRPVDGPRSFDRETILPLLRVFFPGTEKEKTVGGKSFTTYAGGLMILCPKTRESELESLRRGRVPKGFDPSWIATGSDE